jgi:hypothetical protein
MERPKVRDLDITPSNELVNPSQQREVSEQDAADIDLAHSEKVSNSSAAECPEDEEFAHHTLLSF